MAGPQITDHALVRFLDRAGGLDTEGLRGRLQASLARAHAAARKIGGGDYLIKTEGLVFVVRAEKVTTVFPDDAPVHKRAHQLGDGPKQ